MRGLVLAAWLSLTILVLPAPGAQQPRTQMPARGDIELPPLSWTCPMHPEIVDGKEGACPICKMALVPVRLELDWSCPVHTSVIEPASGRCPVCRRSLVQVTAAVFWTCPDHPEVADHPEVKQLQPGRCAIDGRPLVAARERRPHGDHNPRHGGLFFMASDNTHHLEATLPKAGVFRVFVYDEYTRALSLKGISGRAVTREANGRELESFPLVPSSDGTYLEARIGPRALPLEIIAKVSFGAGTREQRFDFSFPGYTQEPSAPAASPVVVLAAPPASAAGGVPPAPAANVTTDALLADLATQGNAVQALLQRGAYAEMYYPALTAKEDALALEQRANARPAAIREQIADATKRVVQAAWLVDMYGDLGNKPKLTEASVAFSRALADLISAHATAR